MQKFQPYAMGIFRILVGYMFLLHAMTKFIHIPYVEMFAHIEPLSLEGVARCFDLLGALSFIFGLFVRPIAFIQSGFMAAAYFIAHGNTEPLLPLINDGEGAILYSFICFIFFLYGPGKFALDNVLARRKYAKYS